MRCAPESQVRTRLSPLEGDGFEPSVPGTKEPVFVAEGELRDRTGQPKRVVSYAVPMFESISLQRRVCELSVPRRRTLVLFLGWSAIGLLLLHPHEQPVPRSHRCPPAPRIGRRHPSRFGRRRITPSFQTDERRHGRRRCRRQPTRRPEDR